MRNYATKVTLAMNEPLTDGTPLNTRWKGQVDKLANLLQQFQDANIPVLPL